MYLRVVYKKKSFDYIPADRLSMLITLDEITHFYRPSEKRWVSIRFDAIRGAGGRYSGPERRCFIEKRQPAEERAGEPCSPNWLDHLWRHIATS